MNAGDYVIYQDSATTCQIGKIKRITERGAFVYYHEGDTAALTPFDKLIPIRNDYTIKSTTLGGAGNGS